MPKSDYEPAQRHGINRFRLCEEWITLIHPGAGVDYVEPGGLLLLRRSDDRYWCGRAYDDVFLFLLGVAVPVSRTQAFEFLNDDYRMRANHAGNDFVSQQELDF